MCAHILAIPPSAQRSSACAMMNVEAATYHRFRAICRVCSSTLPLGENSCMGDRVGQQLGHYQLQRLLGRGAFAEVYLARHRYLEVPAAIKLLHVSMDQEALEQFQREARTL